MRLDVGVIGTEELFGALDRERLHGIHRETAAVPPLSGITLGVLVGQDAAGRGADGAGHVVFGGDQVDRGILLLDLPDDRGVYLRVGVRQPGRLVQPSAAVDFV